MDKGCQIIYKVHQRNFISTLHQQAARSTETSSRNGNNMTEAQKVLADAKWWKTMVPEGWRLYGFNSRNNAAFFSPDERMVDVDGELISALLGKAPKRKTNSNKEENQIEVLRHHCVEIPESWKSCNV